MQATEDILAYYHKLLEDLLQSLRLGREDQLDQLVEVIQNTVRNSVPEAQDRYTGIREVVYSILEEHEDAEGSDVDMGQGQ